MTSTLLLRVEAVEDVEAAYRWYESKRSALGEEFLLCVEAALRSIQRRHDMYRRIHGAIRRCLLRRFPYAVFFIVENDNIVVLAVLHCKQSPNRWKSRR